MLLLFENSYPFFYFFLFFGFQTLQHQRTSNHGGSISFTQRLFSLAFLIPLHFFFGWGFIDSVPYMKESERNGKKKFDSVTEKTGGLRNVECQADDLMNDIFSFFSPIPHLRKAGSCSIYPSQVNTL